MIIFHRHWKIPFSWWFGTIQKPVVDLSLFFLKERQWPQPVWSQTAAPSPKARSTSSRCRMHIRDCCWKLDNVFRVHEGKPWKSWKCSFISCFMSSVSTVNSNMYYRCTYGPWVLHEGVNYSSKVVNICMWPHFQRQLRRECLIIKCLSLEFAWTH